RSLKICTAAGDSASEIRTLGFVIGFSFEKMKRHPGRSATWREEPGPIFLTVLMGPGSRGETAACPGRQLNETYAAFGSCALASANAQSIHCVSSATSFASTGAPH